MNSHLFDRIVREMHRRSEEERESGAFLLGEISTQSGVRTIRDVIYYEDLDSECTRSGGIELDAIAFSRAWTIAAERNLIVVADIHSHPGIAEQSSIDRNSPAVAKRNHIAIIVPAFGRAGGSRVGLGVFEYQGAKNWRTISAAEQRRYVEVGWWI